MQGPTSSQTFAFGNLSLAAPSLALAAPAPVLSQSQLVGPSLGTVGIAPLGVPLTPTPILASSAWPVSKMRAVIERGRGDRSFLAVMFLSGRLSPVHRGHLQAMHVARNRLEDLGYSVVGGWLSPSHERHCQSNDLSASLRVKLTKIAIDDDPLLETSTWESSQSDKHTPADVAEALKVALGTEFPKQKDWLYIFRVCGSDDYKEDLRVVDFSKSFGTVIIPRQGFAPPPEQKRALVYIASEGCSSPSFSGATVREAISKADLGVASLLPAGVARLITAPTGKEWDELGKEFMKLGAKTPTSIAMRESVAPKVAQPKTAGPSLPPPSATTPPPLPQLPVPCPICAFTGAANARYCSECGSKLTIIAAQQPPLRPPPIATVAPALQPGGLAKEAGIVPPSTASLQTLQALDNIIKALKKRGLNLERVFRLLDVDRSGTLQKDEFMAAMQNFTGAEVSREELIAMWMVADANQDGQVTLEEFLTFLGKVPSHVAEAQKLQAQKLGTAEEQPKASGPALSPRLRHAVLKVWGVLAHNAKLAKGMDSWQVERLAHSGSRELMVAVAAWSPWDRHKPPEERSVRISDFLNAVMESTDLTRNQASALATALGFAFGKAETEELLVPVLAANLQTLRFSIRDQEKLTGVGGDEVSVASGAARIEMALLGVQQVRKEAKQLQPSSEPSTLEAAEVRAYDLLYLGVDLTLPLFNDDDGCTLLMLASAQGWIRFCRSLCTSPAPSWRGGIRTYVNIQSTGHGWTALLCAVWNRRFAVARLLLQFQADPNIPSCRGGVTPLMLAADAGDLDMCEALLSMRADPLAQSCDTRDALNFVAERLKHADDSSRDSLCAIFELLDVASAPVLVPTEAETRKMRRRTKRVTYMLGEQIRIQWRALNGEAEVLVRSISEFDRAYEIGVRTGWALLFVNGDNRPLQDHSTRLQTLGNLAAPVTLDFGRPIHVPDDLWMEQLTNMVNTKRQNPPMWKDVARMKVVSNSV